MPIFHPNKWAIEHFSHANLGDTLRTYRLTNVAQQMATFSAESIAKACDGVDAQREGTYRLIKNEHVISHYIRRARFQCTEKNLEL